MGDHRCAIGASKEFDLLFRHSGRVRGTQAEAPRYSVVLGADDIDDEASPGRKDADKLREELSKIGESERRVKADGGFEGIRRER